MKARAMTVLLLATVTTVSAADAKRADARPVPAHAHAAEKWGIAPCRLDSAMPPIVAEIVQAVWTAGAAKGEAPGRIVVNPKTIPAGAVPLFFVNDSLLTDDPCAVKAPGRGDGDVREFDSQTIGGVCRATDGAVVCSADAIREMVKIDQFVEKEIWRAKRRNVSPALVYLFAHELAHIRLKHPGAFTEGMADLDLSGSPTEKIETLTDLCHVDQRQVEREHAADEAAFDVARRIFDAPPYRPRGADELDALTGNADSVYFASKTLTEWGLLHFGAPSQQNAFPGKAELCSMMQPGHGTIVIPVFGGSHPHAWSRLATITELTGKYVQSVRRSRPQDPSGDGERAADNLDRLGDAIRAAGFEASYKRFCSNVSALEAGTLDCSTPEDEVMTVDLGNTTSKVEDDAVLPVTFVPGHAPGSLAANDAWLLFFEISSYDDPASKEAARDEAQRMKASYEAFLGDLEAHRQRGGGRWMVVPQAKVTTSFNEYLDDYMVAVKDAFGVACVARIEPKTLNSWKALRRWGTVNEVEAVPFKDVTAVVYLTFDDGSGGEDASPSFMVTTKDLPLRDIFAADAESCGARPAPLLADIIRFAQQRLQARHGKPVRLGKGGDGGVSIRFHGRETHHISFTPPPTWSGAERPDRPPSLPAAQLLARIERVHANGEEQPIADVLGAVAPR